MKNVILDTNVFIRFLIRDIENQFLKSKQIFDKVEKEGLIAEVSILVVNEIVWVLENFYELKREIYIPQLVKILDLRNIRIIEAKKSLVLQVLESSQKQNFDFTDIYLAHIKGPKEIFSFDKDFRKIKT